jgi:hypothetical protein
MIPPTTPSLVSAADLPQYDANSFKASTADPTRHTETHQAYLTRLGQQGIVHTTMPFFWDGIVHTWCCSRCDAKIPGSKRSADTQQKELYDHMQGIALEAPADQVDRYSSAAGSFRIPYWDWAQGKAGGGVPDFFTKPSITVKTTKGDEKEIPNPLYAYKFKPLIEGDFTGKVCNLGGLSGHI